VYPGTLYAYGQKEERVSIPSFPDLRPLTLNDKTDIASELNSQYLEGAEYTFANMFAWREFEPVQVTRLNGNLCFQTSPYREPMCCFLHPVGSDKIVDTIDQCLNYLTDKVPDPKIVRVPGTFLEKFGLTGRFNCSPDRDNSDYVYLVSDLARLGGRKYDGKRNHIHKVRARGDYVYRDLTPELIADCKNVLSSWSRHKHETEDVANLESLIYGEKAIHQYLDHFDELGLCGGVILKDDKVVAFTVAGRLNKDTAVTYTEVSLPEEKGLNQLLNQEFCLNGLKDFKYVNREQDLGHAGLRKAKMSYHPHHLVDKFIIRRK
jgi:hypothetical protein